jgi:hypothetical protein
MITSHQSAFSESLSSWQASPFSSATSFMIATEPQQLLGVIEDTARTIPHDVRFRTLGVLRGVLEG